MGLKKFVKKAGKFVKKAAAVYATVQTGGLAGAAIGLAQKAAAKGKKPRALPGGVMTQAGFESLGVDVQEASLPVLASAAARAAPAIAGLFRGGAMVATRGGKLAKVARGVGGAIKSVGGAVAAGVIADRVIDAAGNVWTRKKRSRRINPLNVKAARRAIRRIKGVRKITAQIERSLPKQKAKSAACPPFTKKKC